MDTAKLTPTWYCLYAGQSADGMGSPDYVGRTVDIQTAAAHLKSCRDNPYSTGHVQVFTDATASCVLGYTGDRRQPTVLSIIKQLREQVR